MTGIFLLILGISLSVGLAVIVLILLTPFLNKRYAAKWKYLIWIFLALRLLIPFNGFNGRFVMDRLLQIKQQSVSGTEENYTDNLTDAAIPYRRIVVELPAQMATPIKAEYVKTIKGVTRLDAVAFAWIIGSLIFMSVHFISYFHYKRQLMKKGKMIEDVHILSHIFKLKYELHIKHTIRVMEYYKAESPMIIGFLKPVLVLPKEQYSSEEIFFILKHELVHLKREDVYLKLLFVIANAVHWFNPLIWIMHKEAVIDMELSCDERVTQGASYAVRKAYTETLLSILHKRCVRGTAFSTQFYGGKKVMKKRFENILLKKEKKNGMFILICVIVLTISLGMMVGCSIAKENITKENIAKEDNSVKEDTGNENTETLSSQPEQENVQTEPIHSDNFPAEDNTSENTAVLTFSKEGEQEQKKAALAVGGGYSLYLPDDEEWRLSGPDLWTTDINEEVSLWITHFEGETMDSVNQKLVDDGYVKEDDYKWLKQTEDRIYHVILKAYQNDIWGIFYSYTADCEEGWGQELPVIADTFALLNVTDGDDGNSSGESVEYLGSEDCQEIRDIVYEFTTAYFDGNIETMRSFLSSTYVGDIDKYESTGSISDLTVKGLTDTDEKKVENGICTVSMEFKDSNYEDMFLYLTIELIKQEDNWKIQFYGVEG